MSCGSIDWASRHRVAESKRRFSNAANFKIRKTEICIEYSYRYRKQAHDSWVFWINGPDIWRSYLEIAQRLHFSVDEDLLHNVATWMQNPRKGQWLAIMDDFDFDGTNLVLGDFPLGIFPKSAWEQHLKDIWSYVHREKQSFILVTSNSTSSLHTTPPDATQLLNHSVIRVPSMSEKEAVDLILSHVNGQARIEPSEATRIIAQIGRQPLTIRQTALYMQATETRDFDFLDAVKSAQAASRDLSLEDAGRLINSEDGAVPPRGFHSIDDMPRRCSNFSLSSIDSQTWVSASAGNNRADVLNASSFIAKTLLSDLRLKKILKTALFSPQLPDKEERLRLILEKFSAQIQALADGSIQQSIADFLRQHYRRVAFATLQESASEKRADANTKELIRRDSSDGSGRLGEVLENTNNWKARDVKPKSRRRQSETVQSGSRSEAAKSFITDHIPYLNLVDSIYKDIATSPDPQDIVEFVSNFLENSAKLSRFMKLPIVYQPAIFFVDWELSTVMQEFDEIPRLGDVLVISGSLVNAQAATVEEYISQNWPKGGIPVLRALENMNGRSKNEGAGSDVKSPNAGDCQEHTMVTISGYSTSENPDRQVQISVEGTLSVQAEAAATISWLAAAVRHSDILKLTESVSSLTFIPSKAGPSFKVQSLELKPVGGSSSCWHSLFRHTAVALNYPVTPRKEGKGLDISFSAMASLARTDMIVERQDGFVVRGLKWMLIPMKYLRHDHDRAVQWHLIKVSDVDSFLKNQKAWLKPRNKSNLGEYIAKRAFLGWCDNTLINVATKDSSYDIKVSSARTRVRRLNFTAISAPLSIGYKGANIGINPTFQLLPRQDQTHFNLANDIEERLTEKLKSHLVIYDSATQRAWMLPYLNVLLHLAHMRAAMLANKPHERIDPQERLPPYAISSADKYEAAYQAMQPLVELVRGNSNDIENLTATAGASGRKQQEIQDRQIVRAKYLVKYLESVMKGLDESHKKLRDLTDNDVSIARAKRRIYGFEMTDIAKGSTEPRFKEHRLRYTADRWSLIVREQGVLFCSGIGHAITRLTPAEEGKTLENLYTQMPAEQDYLGALVPCLLALHQKAGDYEGQGILTGDHKHRWEPTDELFNADGPQNSRACFPTAQVIKNHHHSKKASRVQNWKDHNNGAVVFGRPRRWSREKGAWASWQRFFGLDKSKPHKLSDRPVPSPDLPTIVYPSPIQIPAVPKQPERGEIEVFGFQEGKVAARSTTSRTNSLDVAELNSTPGTTPNTPSFEKSFQDRYLKDSIEKANMQDSLSHSIEPSKSLY